MLVSAREAGIANRHAPAQQRRSTGISQISSRFGPSIQFWINPRGTTATSGNTVASVRDFGKAGLTVSQSTSTKRPIMAAPNGAPAFLFDGVDDGLVTSSIDLSATQAITIGISDYRKTSPICVEVEQTVLYYNVSTAFTIVGNDANATNVTYAFSGNVGFQVAQLSKTTNVWGATVAVMDKSKAAASELLVYDKGLLATVTRPNTSENTNSFGAGALYIGSRNNGASAVLNGAIGHLIILNRALSASEAANFSLFLASAAGVA